MNYEQITLISPGTTDDGKPELIVTETALMLAPCIAVYWGNGHAVIDNVKPCEFFGGEFYEVAPGYKYPIAEFHYENEAEILPWAISIMQVMAAIDPERLVV
ncbi:hypothetical protein QPM05_06215 [Caldibacillus thermoamylovorans]|nr:hypothetical protein [Caldibacillus thermoamylovorans]